APCHDPHLQRGGAGTAEGPPPIPPTSRRRFGMGGSSDATHLSPQEQRAAGTGIMRLGRGLAEFELALEEFDDPKREWTRLFSELLGTFFLVLVGAGGGVVNQASHGAIPLAVRVTAPGLMVLGIILFMGAIGGAHLN